MKNIEKKYTKEEILLFNENDWEFGRSSGYAGYYRKGSEYCDKESNWIYEQDYMDRKNLLEKYYEDYKLLHNFRLEQLEFGKYPDYIIQDFLNNKYFK